MDLVFHMLLPMLSAIFAGVDRRKAMLLMPFAVLPDLDVLFVAHRLIFHSLMVIALFVTGGLLCCRWLLPKYSGLAVLASLYMFSHIPLDLFSDGYVGLFWPLTNIGYSVIFDLSITQQSLWPRFDLNMLIDRQYIQNPSTLSGVSAITSEGAALALLFLLVLSVRRLCASREGVWKKVL